MRTLLVAITGTLLGASVASAGEAPTFYKDVLPVLQAHCQNCHRPGEVAPMPLLSYENARPWAKAIKSKVTAREMPPWGADMSQTLPMRNDISLTQKEIDGLLGRAAH